jgi:hypothetical protein
MKIDAKLKPAALKPRLDRFFAIAGKKLLRLDRDWDPAKGAPVFTIKGQYAARGWTEWTQGFQFGCQILQYDATGDPRFLALGLENTLKHMAPHVSHVGVHDHGFNNISTYGNLRRLALEGRCESTGGLLHFFDLALKISGAVQAARWTAIKDGTGFIHSFNGPHSLFSDTIRSCRILGVAHRLGHVLMGENDKRVSLLGRAIEHILNTAKYNVYYGAGRDVYDVRGRVVHESIFNATDGNYRCPSSQQGYSPFTTWTRGQAWAILGGAEELEFLASLPPSEIAPFGKKSAVLKLIEEMARATCDHYIANTATDGIPYWDDGAPGLAKMGDWRSRPSRIDNPYEPVDSSAAAIAAQGLLRLGNYLGAKTAAGKKYTQAGLTVAKTLLEPPYLSLDAKHHGLLLHSVYHRPNGWDYVPKGKKVPMGESSMWGDYHLMELAVYLKRSIEGGTYLTFFG